MKNFSQRFFKLPQLFLMGLVRIYRLLLSPWLGNACRFEPSCSIYSLQALSHHGAVAGSALTIYRLARCQPWCQGGHDPVPMHFSFSRLVTPVAASTTSPISSEKKQS
jgi:putative membrane protein insertion efficiency factor